MRDLGQRHHDTATDRVARVQPGQRAQFEHGGAGVRQSLQALADHHLAAGAVSRHVLLPATGQQAVVQGMHLVDQRAHRCGVLSELVARDGQARAEDRAHVVVSHEGRRFSRKAAIPSSASAPAKSSVDLAAAEASPSGHGCAGRERSNAFVARTAPGAA